MLPTSAHITTILCIEALPATEKGIITATPFRIGDQVVTSIPKRATKPRCFRSVRTVLLPVS